MDITALPILGNVLTMTNREGLEAVGFATHANAYAHAAEALMRLSERGELKLDSDDPVHFLAGHSFELALKAVLIQSKLELSKIPGHDILYLYKELASKTDTVSQLDALVEKRWKDKLHSLRSARQSASPDWFAITDEMNNESSDDIEALKFSLLEAVEWFNSLSFRNKKPVHLLRYHQDRIYKGTHFSFCGHTFDEPLQSFIWASQILANHVIEHG